MGAFILFTSCYSKYVSLDYEVHHGAVWNNEKTCVAFVASKKAYRNATGITRFPDGGIPKYLVNEMSLYLFNVNDLELSVLFNFDDLINWKNSSSSLWFVKIAYTDSLIYFNISPTTGWDWYLSHAKSEKDSMQISQLKEKFTKSFSINIINKSVDEVDTSIFATAYQKCIETNKIDLTELNKMLSDVSLADWGLVLDNLYPKSDKKYIDETIYGYNKSLKTRRAVLEQVIEKKSKKEIQSILKRMDEHSKSLEGLKKMEYDFYMKDTYESIKALL